MNKQFVLLGVAVVCVLVCIFMYMRYVTYYSPSVVNSEPKELTAADKIFFPVFDLFSKRVK